MVPATCMFFPNRKERAVSILGFGGTEVTRHLPDYPDRREPTNTGTVDMHR
jgi:hypothetical protein